jgi:hypothetical protein
MLFRLTIALLLLGCHIPVAAQSYDASKWIHSTIIDHLSKNRNNHCGIIFMDFAGADKLQGNILHPSDYNIQGERLLRAIINSNF